MEIIDLKSYEKLLKTELTPNQHFIYLIIKEGNKDLFLSFCAVERTDKIKHDLSILWNKGYIDNKSEEVNTFEFEKLYIANSINSDDEELKFYKMLYNMFPKGVTSGGTPVRSGEAEFIKKLVQFVKRYPQFSKEVISKATNDYLADRKRNNWQFVMQAGYFVSKKLDGVEKSTLASWCENASNGSEPTSFSTKDIKGGTNIDGL